VTAADENHCAAITLVDLITLVRNGMRAPSAGPAAGPDGMDPVTPPAGESPPALA
jgi:hypothetical protein